MSVGEPVLPRPLVRDELFNREIFDILLEVSVAIELLRWEYHLGRRHISLEYKPLAPEAVRLENFTLQMVHWWEAG